MVGYAGGVDKNVHSAERSVGGGDDGAAVVDLTQVRFDKADIATGFRRDAGRHTCSRFLRASTGDDADGARASQLPRYGRS